MQQLETAGLLRISRGTPVLPTSCSNVVIMGSVLASDTVSLGVATTKAQPFMPCKAVYGSCLLIRVKLTMASTFRKMLSVITPLGVYLPGVHAPAGNDVVQGR